MQPAPNSITGSSFQRDDEEVVLTEITKGARDPNMKVTLAGEPAPRRLGRGQARQHVGVQAGGLSPHVLWRRVPPSSPYLQRAGGRTQELHCRPARDKGEEPEEGTGEKAS